MDRAIGTSVEVVVRNEAAESLEADRFYASLVYGFITVPCMPIIIAHLS